MENKHVPKWRKLGLKLKQPQEEQGDGQIGAPKIDVEGSNKQSKGSLPKSERGLGNSSKLKQELPNKKATKRSGKDIDQQDGSNERRKVKKKKKAPRVTKPQSPSDSDQRALTYLKLHHSNRGSWKFNKSLQNWILRNVDVIPEQYEEELLGYLTTLQGAARARMVEEASSRSEPRFLRLVGLLHEE